MGAKLMKRAEKEAELTGVVGFRRGDTVVALSLADPVLGSSPCQKVNCCSGGAEGSASPNIPDSVSSGYLQTP